LSELRVIKKYPNRRLYDTLESRYITLADIRSLVVEGADFVVIERKSQEDITRSILLQVISEQEHQGEPLMSRQFLADVIRSYGTSIPAELGTFLEGCLHRYASEHRLQGKANRDISPLASQALERG